MKHIVCIALLVLLPFMTFAQGYSLSLQGVNERITCDVLGSANGYLYYQTPNASMVVVPLSSVKHLYKGRSDVAPLLLRGDKIPFKSDVMAYFPNLPDSLLEVSNANLVQQQQVNELRGIKNTLGIMVAVSIASFASLIYIGSRAKK